MKLVGEIFREEDGFGSRFVHIVGSDFGLVDFIPEEQHPASINNGITFIGSVKWMT
jgi:hypothetical protein